MSVYGLVYGSPSVYGLVYGGFPAVGAFGEKAVHSSVMSWVENNFSAAQTVVYDSEPADLEAASEWAEFDVTTFDDPAQRKTNRRLMRATVTVHVFAKRSANLHRRPELVDAVVALFDHAEIPLYDYDESGPPQVGHLHLLEVKIEERSDEFNAALLTDGRHFLCTVDGLAEASA